MPLNSLTVWIPVGVGVGSVLLTVALGVVYQTHHFDKRIEDLEKRLIDRIERLENPVFPGK